jgi:hypothetical protein
MKLTLADIAKITGAKPRSVQLWAEAGVLKADPITERRGSGVHRTFSRDEGLVACVVNAFAVQGVAIGNLLHAANGVRNHYLPKPHLREAFEDALIGSGSNYLIYDLKRGSSSIGIWSSRRTKVALHEMLTKTMGADDIVSAVFVNLNAALANASRLNEA